METPPPPPPPHVIIFPLPLQGPINSMLKLAELLSLAGLRVTFLNTIHNHHRLLRFSSVPSRLAARFPHSFRFVTYSDGLPDDHPRSGDRVFDLFSVLQAAATPPLRRLLSSSSAACLIASDGVFYFALDVADEFRVPIFYFGTLSPACVWIYLCLPELLRSGELPFSGDDDLDVPIRSVWGMDGFLRRRDLPSFFRRGDAADPILQLVLAEAAKIPRARGLIFDAFEELEALNGGGGGGGGGVLSHMRAAVGRSIYAIGPLHSLLKARAVEEQAETTPSTPAANSLWEVDRSCLAWLDAQPPRSVVYVSFGSVAVMTAEQAEEFWHGLVGSGQRFLWVRRPGSLAGERRASEEGERRGNYYMVEWAPQEEVLAHAAVGAFLTHSGWNSTLESVVAGVPMICWPYYVDQQVNSRHVSSVWRLGVDMKDTCDRATVERMVKEVMEARRGALVQSAESAARLARESVGRGGSSSCNMDRLIEDIGLSGKIVRGFE